MGNQGWAKLNNAPYKRIIPNLCPFCQHLGQNKDGSWLVCTAKLKRLSNAHVEVGKCDQYEKAEQKLDDAYIAILIEGAREHKTYLAERKARGKRIFR